LKEILSSEKKYLNDIREIVEVSWLFFISILGFHFNKAAICLKLSVFFCLVWFGYFFLY
jgi:hypothetical protein